MSEGPLLRSPRPRPAGMWDWVYRFADAVRGLLVVLFWLTGALAGLAAFIVAVVAIRWAMLVCFRALGLEM